MICMFNNNQEVFAQTGEYVPSLQVSYLLLGVSITNNALQVKTSVQWHTV